MSIAFQRGEAVAPDQVVSSRPRNKLARAFNTRILSGIGDAPYRIHELALNGIREPVVSESGLRVPEDSFTRFYIHADPDYTNVQWPDTEVDQQGNLGSVLPAFVLGNPSVESEADRLSIVHTWLGLRPPATKGEIWVLGGQQRGALDPTTGEGNAPAFEAAQSFYRIVQPWWSFHGKAYGGKSPQPEVIGLCADPEDGTPPRPNQILFFSPLRAGLQKVKYSGTCPENPAGVSYVIRAPFAYYVVLNNGQVQRLDRDDYVEGPYDHGGTLAHEEGEHIARALQLYAKDFRGTPTERTGDFEIEEIGFDFERFISSQYFLSPNKGKVIAGRIHAAYPTWTLSTTGTAVSANTIGTLSFSTPEELVLADNTHNWAPGYVLGGFYARARGITAPVTLVLEEVVTIFGAPPGYSEEIILTPDANGFVELLKFYPAHPKDPTRAFAPQGFQVRLKETANFRAGGGDIVLQCTEQAAYKGRLHDFYLVTRVSSTTGGATQVVDGRGDELQSPIDISNTWFEQGAIRNDAADGLPQPIIGVINDNGAYESYRRFWRKHIRVIGRENIDSYAVIGGKSVLWIRRYALGLKNQQIDLLEGIADAIGPATALKNSNQWCAHADLQLYSNFDDNIFNPDKHADVNGPNERCHFWSGEILGSSYPELAVAFGQRNLPLKLASAPPGYRYIDGTNGTPQHGRLFPDVAEHWKSCRIYEPPVLIESAVSDGPGLVKITFTGRFQHDASAPASIPRDIGAWSDLASLAAEKPRTMENGIREGLAKAYLGIECSQKSGDAALSSTIWYDFNVRGACLARIYLTHLIPEVPEDNNETEETDFDTPTEVDAFYQMEWYLKAMAPGFIDGSASISSGCKQEGSLLFDLTYQNLCYKAIGERSIGFTADPTRTDKPWGAGPLPNTLLYAAMFNKFVACINELTRARVELPMVVEQKTDYYLDSVPTTPSWPASASCGPNGIGIYSGSPGSASTLFQSTEWQPVDAVGVDSGAGYATDCPFHLVVSRAVASYRTRLPDERMLAAIPPDLLELLNANYTGFFGVYTVSERWQVKHQVSASGDAAQCQGGGATLYDASSTTGYYLEDKSVYLEQRCGLFNSGSIDSGAPPASDFVFFNSGGQSCILSGSVRTISIQPVPWLANILWFVAPPIVD